jgi:hypothetical protein
MQYCCQHRLRFHRTRAARRMVGGGTRGAHATSAAHSSRCPSRQSARCAARLAYCTSRHREHLASVSACHGKSLAPSGPHCTSQKYAHLVSISSGNSK